MPTADWYHRDFYSAPVFSEAGRQRYMRDGAGIRNAIEWLNRNGHGQAVLLTDGSETAGLHAPVHANNWLDYAFNKKVQASPRAIDVYHLLTQDQIAHLVVDRSKSYEERQASVTELITTCGQPEFASGNYAAMKIRPDCEQALAEKPLSYGLCTPNEPLRPGQHDEIDPLITFRGPWKTETKFPLTYHQTMTFSNAPGAQAPMSLNPTKQ